MQNVSGQSGLGTKSTGAFIGTSHMYEHNNAHGTHAHMNAARNAQRKHAHCTHLEPLRWQAPPRLMGTNGQTSAH
eukprot:7920504-Alexandrium_andersonii.AAC.1